MTPARPEGQTIRAERLRDQELTVQVLPYLVARFRQKADPATAAAEVQARFSLEARKAYRWTAIVYEQLEKSRRRIATAFAAILWGGALLLLIAGVGALAGRFSVHRPPVTALLLLTGGGVLLVVGIAGGLHARHLARVPQD